MAEEGADQQKKATKPMTFASRYPHRKLTGYTVRQAVDIE